MSLRNSSFTVRPLMSMLAVDRLSGAPIPGRYCDQQRLWVVEVEGETQPLIDIAHGLAEIVTKTKVEMESDDQPALGCALELATKTLTQTEQDDQAVWGSTLLALVTKTDVNQEEDKQDLDAFGTALLEVSTKTSTNAYRDGHARCLPDLFESAVLN